MAMNKIRSYIFIGLSMLSLSSCNEWLDVKPETEVREDDLFSSYKGYKEALAGCYSAMTSRDLYGEKLTISDVECLANLWNQPSKSYTPALYDLHIHDYEDEYARNDIKTIYGGLYNVIVQANGIINHITANPASIPAENQRNIIEGEARAVRAFCHFDVLRLFGQMPQNATKTVELPYSESNDINTLPPYYSFEQFAAKVLADLDIAEEKLKTSDPVMEFSYDELAGADSKLADQLPDDDFLLNRRYRFNYWAVRALKARVYLYIGDKAKAYNEAMAVINAQIKGKSVVSLSSKSDYENKKYSTPSECLMQLYNVDLLDYSIDLIGGDPERNVNTDKHLYLTSNNFEKKLFAGANTTSDVRYLNLWDRTTKSSTGSKYPTIKKYFKVTTMPLLRLSEMYLIAMETTTNLAEANSLYKTFMAARNVNITTDIESEVDLLDKVINEYRLDFYAEGQMFYCYKRLAVKSMLFSYENMGEEQYIIPLPSSEFNPAGK